MTSAVRRTVVARPPNDDFASAVDLGSERMVKWNGPGHGEVTRWTWLYSRANIEREAMTLSSLEPGEPVHSLEPKRWQLRGSLWWRWTGSRTEKIRLYGSGATAIYAGDSLQNLVPVVTTTAADTDAIAFMATAGITYHIAGLRGADLTPAIELWLVAETPGVLNDAFADRVSVFATDSPDVFAFQPVRQAVGAATIEKGEPTPPPVPSWSDPFVSTWWRWRCPVSGFYQFTSAEFGWETAARLYTGDRLDTLLENPRSERGDYAAIAGREYVIGRYHLPDEDMDDPTLLSRVTWHPYARWAGQWPFTDENDLLESATPSGDGVRNALKFYCGLDPSRNAYGDDEPNAINLPQLITTASGARAIRYRFDWSNVPSALMIPGTLTRGSSAPQI